MALPVSVTLQRPGTALDLTPLVDESSLSWSSVIPGGFGSCSFKLLGDPRKLVKEVPYLSIVRVAGSSGRVLFEGQVEDRQMSITESDLSLTVQAFGLQNALKEQSVRRIWSKRDMEWVQASTLAGMKTVSSVAMTLANNSWATSSGQFDPVNPTITGAQILGVVGATPPLRGGMAVEFDMPSGLTAVRILGTCLVPTTNNYSAGIWSAAVGANFGDSHVAYVGVSTTDFDQLLNSNAAQIRLGAWITSSPTTLTVSDGPQFYNLRVLATSVTEDVAAVSHAGGSFYGSTLIRGLLAQVPALSAGVIERGTDFSIDHLDAGARRFAADILGEIAQYYSRDWAVWEDAKLSWVTPNLKQNEWIITIAQLSSLNLDASVVNSNKRVIVAYTDAASLQEGEQSSTATDRRNPYVLNARAKDEIVQAGSMTSSTATQLSSALLNGIGFGPVPAAGTISLPMETIVQHAQGNALKACEIRAGDNVTIPELPLVDVFTQDGRGEVLFRVISADADGSSGQVTLSLDTYGSKRSDVLLARLAAVTNLLGG